jgi:hypothetical protein
MRADTPWTLIAWVCDGPELAAADPSKPYELEVEPTPHSMRWAPYCSNVRSGESAEQLGSHQKTLTLDGTLPFDAKKMLTCMITKGNYFLSICIGKK